MKADDFWTMLMRAANEWDNVPTFNDIITTPWVFDINGLVSILEYIGNNTHELRIEAGDGVIRVWRHEPAFRPTYSWATYQPPSDTSLMDVIMRLGVVPEKVIDRFEITMLNRSIMLKMYRQFNQNRVVRVIDPVAGFVLAEGFGG